MTCGFAADSVQRVFRFSPGTNGRQVAFRNPGVTKQTVLHVRFDQAGNVASVDRTGKELVMNVSPSKRSTPTLGRQRSFFEELFGNIGTVGSAGLPGSKQ